MAIDYTRAQASFGWELLFFDSKQGLNSGKGFEDTTGAGPVVFVESEDSISGAGPGGVGPGQVAAHFFPIGVVLVAVRFYKAEVPEPGEGTES